MDSEPVRVYGTGGQAYFGRREEPSLRCRDCDKADTCPQFVKSRIALDYGAEVETPDYCVWSKAMDLDDHAVLAITYVWRLWTHRDVEDAPIDASDPDEEARNP